MTTLSVSAKPHKTKSQTRRAISDGVVYAQVFQLVDGFEKEAEKLSDEQAKNHFKNYFVREANLTEEQQQFLKIAAYNFTSASGLI